MPVFHNIAAYKFAPLDNLKDRRAHLLARCKEWNLKGTILLSTEGINLFVAGRPADIQNLTTELRAIPGLADFPIKLSESEHQPFNRMLVRIKKEIIAFGVEGIDPARYTSPRISPATLKQFCTICIRRKREARVLATNQKSKIRNQRSSTFLVFPCSSRIFPPFALDACVPQHCSL